MTKGFSIRMFAAVLAMSSNLALPTSPAFAQHLAATVSQADQDEGVRQLIRRLDPSSDVRHDRKKIEAIHVPYASLSDHQIHGWDQPMERERVAVDYSRSVNFDLFFKPGSSRISQDGHFVLSLVAEGLQSQDLRKCRFLIGGHADATGSYEQNLELSWRRAEAVKLVLIEEFGISPARLVTVGFGEDRPLDASNPRGRENRKVDLTLVIDWDQQSKWRWSFERDADAIWGVPLNY